MYHDEDHDELRALTADYALVSATVTLTEYGASQPGYAVECRECGETVGVVGLLGSARPDRVLHAWEIEHPNDACPNHGWDEEEEEEEE